MRERRGKEGGRGEGMKRREKRGNEEEGGGRE